MIRAILLCFLFVGVVRAENPTELFNFGCDDPAPVYAESTFAIKYDEVIDPVIIVEEIQPTRSFFRRFRNDLSILSVEELARRPFLDRLRSRFQFGRLGRLRARANFATTGFNTRLQNLSLFFPRALFNLR